jgi:UDP-N-acetylmuramyl pentapeptide phosphotransferase/UDP-N-acetylglucosamine-1-phosphate transferase
MVAFGASPLGRVALRHLLSRVSEPHAARLILKGFSGIFLTGGIAITAGVCIGLVLAWNAGVGQTWITASIALITIAGVGGVAIEDRWVKRLLRANDATFSAVLHEKVPFLAAIASPVLWLGILWLMINKPA